MNLNINMNTDFDDILIKRVTARSSQYFLSFYSILIYFILFVFSFTLMQFNCYLNYFDFRVVVVVFFPDVMKSLTDNEEFKKGMASQKDLQKDPMASWKRAMGLETKHDDDDE